VTVPEDRSGDPFDTIEIAVTIYHGASNTPKPDPILYLQGGPGDRAIEWSAEVYEHVIAPLPPDRDFIVFDPRGVGLSRPRLDCDEIRQTYISDLQGKLPPDQKISYYEGALLVCKNRLQNEGVNLSAYTSTQMAMDAVDVLTALGYQQVNLYGASYGTRIAQLIMRDHPEYVRSAILDSVVPIEVRLFDQNAGGSGQALESLFESCRNDPSCSSAYPDLEAVYNSTVEQLNTRPLILDVPVDQIRTIEKVVDGASFQSALINMFRSPQTISTIPRLIYRTHGGDNSSLAISTAFPIYAFSSISVGTYISVNCHDQIIAMSWELLDKAIYELCQLWGTTPLEPGENDPVISDIPTLIFAGEFDLVTPPSFARQLADHLSASHMAVIPKQGHTPSLNETSGCPATLISTFLQNPATEPDFACLEEIETIKFVMPYNAATPLTLEPVTIEQYHIRTLIPAGWSDSTFGFYNRNDSFGDVTQIGMQSAAVPEDEWSAWLITNFQGNQGLDRPAAQKVKRQANGLTWSIYETSSRGHPVDIAFASSGRQTLMILMISHADEHEALLQYRVPACHRLNNFPAVISASAGHYRRLYNSVHTFTQEAQ
jgi:pimeloyl-ACP methyl ester carboxylesterase